MWNSSHEPSACRRPLPSLHTRIEWGADLRASMHNLRRSATLHLNLRLFLLFAGTTLACATAQPQSPQSIHPIQQTSLPAGWKVFPTPPKTAMSCIAPTSRRGSRSRSPTPEPLRSSNFLGGKSRLHLPKLPPGELTMPGMLGAGISGLRSVLKLQDGWLSGFDQGEWGGHLYFVDATGKATELYQENVLQCLIETSRGVMVLAGLAHLSLDSGEVLIADYPITVDTKLHHLASLEGAPQAFTKISPDEALVITTHGISRITSSGTHQTLTHSRFGILYPNSIVSTPEGTIYAGMRLFVVRLMPTSKPDDYTEQWLVPESCEQFHQERFTCSCSK